MIERAVERIDPAFLDTPILCSEALNRRCNLELLLKDETATPIRSFKGRGACVLAYELEERASLVCASAGNFGQGLAWAAGARGTQLTVFASTNAVPSKIAAMRKFGASVILAGNDFDEAKEEAIEWSRRNGGMFVEDGAHPQITEGAGTIALELTGEAGCFDTILCPLGNGALASGVGAWMKASSPATEVVGVCAAAAPAMALSFRARAVIETPQACTIADGIAIRKPVSDAVVAVCEVVDDVVLVEEHHLREAMELIKAELGVTVEPAGAAGFAAMIADPGRWAGKRVAAPLCGGNV